MLLHYIEHRHEVVLRRTMFDLGKAEERAHILEGLLKALDIIDEIVATIRASSDAETARRSLIDDFGFSERQAQAILDMRLHRLTALERDELAAEQAELMQLIERLRALAGSRDARMAVVLEELRAVGEAFGQPRRTRIDEDASNDLEMEDLIPDDSVVIMVSSAGYIKRLPLDTWKSQRRGGKGITGATTREEDSLEQVYVASNHSNILFITNLGYCYWLKAYRVPEETRHSKGKAIVNLLDLAQGERPVASICLRDRGESGYLVMVTSNGIVKRTPLSEYRRPRSTGLRAVKLAEGVGLVTASVTTGESEILLMSRRGRVIRFSEGDVRATGRYTSGVRGMRLVKGDEVVGMVVLTGEGDILSMTANGYGKRTPVQEHPIRRRGGIGVIGIRASERNGPVVAVMQVPPENELILVSARGMVIRLLVSDVRLCGRNTQGVRLMNLPEDDRLVDATAFEPEGGEDSQLDASGNGRVDESV
jgi:DNA gyrase subunit A